MKSPNPTIYPNNTLRVHYDVSGYNATDHGATLFDISGHNRHATIYGSPEFDGKSFVFDGSSTKKIALSNLGNSAGDWPHTVAWWQYLEPVSTNSSSEAFFIGTAASTRKVIAYSNRVKTYDKIQWSYYFYGHDFRDFTDTTADDTGVWMHVALVYDSNTNMRYKYVNGVLRLSGHGSAGSSVDNNIDANSPMFIAHDGIRNEGYFNGRIGEFVVYDTPLTEAEVIDVYNRKKNIYMS